MRRYKFFINFDKEEQWLNEMSKQGYELTNKSIGYEFQAAQPENRVIKVDYRTFKNREDFEDYRALFEDSGWSHIAGTKNSGAQYFKRTDNKGRNDIFSDTDSKAVRYKRVAQMWISLASCFIPIFAALISTGAIDAAAILNPKLLYYTPGLWEKTGTAFWRAFLFETPFAFSRGILWMIIPVMIILYFIFAVKAKKQYQKTQQESLIK